MIRKDKARKGHDLTIEFIAIDNEFCDITEVFKEPQIIQNTNMLMEIDLEFWRDNTIFYNRQHLWWNTKCGNDQSKDELIVSVSEQSKTCCIS